MAAFFHLAWALAPGFVHRLVHHNDNRARGPSLRAVAAKTDRARPRRRLHCHWERAKDGSLVAHWVREDEASGRDSRPASTGGLLVDVPADLIDDAYRCERYGSVLARIAVGRMARLNQSRRSGVASNFEAGSPK